MTRRTTVALLAALLGVAGGIAVSGLTRRGGDPLPPPTTADVAYPVPPFSLTERTGKPITNADLVGKVWIASFVFTRCNGPCPAVTATVARLNQELAAEPGLRFVTFTVDPKRDKPNELKAYADRYQADPERWLFLTGPEADLHKLMIDGFKVGVTAKPNPQPGDEFDHSTRLVVVDKSGVIRGYYDGFPPDPGTDAAAFEANLARLKAKVAELVR